MFVRVYVACLHICMFVRVYVVKVYVRKEESKREEWKSRKRLKSEKSEDNNNRVYN
jgi:hypothetical protein